MLTWILAAIMTLSPGLVLAHAGHEGSGHGSGFLAGLGHPIGGLDHVLAMVAVGLWAALLGGRAIWSLPLAFITAMLAGGAAGALALPLPGVEPMILASIVALGTAAALALRLPPGAAIAVAAVFGLFHGHAHGSEGPAEGLALYAAGFAIATAALHSAGLALGFGITRVAAQVLAGLAALAGVALALG